MVPSYHFPFNQLYCSINHLKVCFVEFAHEKEKEILHTTTVICRIRKQSTTKIFLLEVIELKVSLYGYNLVKIFAFWLNLLIVTITLKNDLEYSYSLLNNILHGIL